MRLLVGLSVAFAFGCGDEGKVNKLPDAPLPPDAPASGTVSIEILEGITPRVGVRVLFQNADSSVVADTTTGTDGKASATMEAGGYVTAIDPFVGLPQGVQTTELRTIAGVKPGDQLRLYERAEEGAPLSVDVTVPLDGNAASYTVSTNCLLDYPVVGGEPTQVQLAGCGATAAFLVETYDSQGAPQSSFFKQSVPLAAGGAIDLSGETYAAVPDATFSYTNVAANVTSLSVYGIRETPLGSIHEFTAGADVSAGAATVIRKVPAIPNATAATLTAFSGPMYTQHMVAEWGPASATYALDATGLFLREFTAPATLDAAAHAVTWMQAADGAQPDFVVVNTYLDRDSGGTLQSWEWQIAAPAASSVVLPVLPDSSPLNPQPGDTGFFYVTAAKVPGGYDGIRASVLAIENFQDIATGATGQASFAVLVEPNARVRTRETPLQRGFTRRAR